MKYTAVIEKYELGYSIYFPMLPGCITYGKTLEEVKENASEALYLHLSIMSNREIEFPMSIEKPKVDWETEPGFEYYEVEPKVPNNVIYDIL